MQKRMKAFIGAVTGACIISFFGMPAVFAAETANSEYRNTLSIKYEYNDLYISGAEFDIYCVGKVTADGMLTLTGVYADYPVSLNGLTDSEFQIAASTLYDYVQMDAHAIDYVAYTDEQGKAVIQNLQDGIYLVAGQSCVLGENEYITEPQLVVLPYEEEGTQESHNHVTLIPKSSIYEEPQELIDVKVLKKWNDNGNTAKRPASITVHLLKDGLSHQTAVLTEENNWRNIWTNLDPRSTWSVAEDVPEGYTVTVEKQGITYVVENTCETPTTPEKPPVDIPQTGVIWWPIPLFGILGGIFLISGIALYRRKGEEDEA